VSRLGKFDQRKAGKSDLVPFIAGETEDERHARRLQVNLAAFKEVRKEAAKRGLSIKTFHDGHHWKFTKPEFLAEWWPSSAKLVFNQDWDHGVHAHDWKQVMQEIDNQLRYAKHAKRKDDKEAK
jgi:hypothetical protein